MSMQKTLLTLAAAAAVLCRTADAQYSRPIAFTNARIHTISGATIERGTLVVRNGKIEAVGADATVPAGAKVIDVRGKTIMPGLVSAWSSAGLRTSSRRSSRMPQRGGRRGRFSRMPTSSGGSASNKAASKVVDTLYARQPIFGDLLEVGITSLALTPPGSGFPGLGAVLDPAGKTLSELTADDDAFVQIGMQRNAAAKKVLKETFAKAKKVVEEREKPPAPPQQKAPAKPAEKAEQKQSTPGGKAEQKQEGKEPPKPAPKPAPKPEPKPGSEKQQDPKKAAPKPAPKAKPKPKDPNLEVLADLLQGKRRAIVRIDSAADLLHWRTAVDDDVKFPRAVVVPRHDNRAGTINLVLDQLKQWDCAVLLPPSLTTLPNTAHLIHPAKKLHDAGVEVGFLVGESTGSVRNLFFQLMELTRCGLPADVALKGVTLVPAKALGIDKRTGSLEAGKDADFLVFDGDPLSPTSKLEQVWHRGHKVETH